MRSSLTRLGRVCVGLMCSVLVATESRTERVIDTDERRPSLSYIYVLKSEHRQLVSLSLSCHHGQTHRRRPERVRATASPVALRVRAPARFVRGRCVAGAERECRAPALGHERRQRRTARQVCVRARRVTANAGLHTRRPVREPLQRRVETPASVGAHADSRRKHVDARSDVGLPKEQAVRTLEALVAFLGAKLQSGSASGRLHLALFRGPDSVVRIQRRLREGS